jgi:EmrB/QacA subfamily drug resistance transporter
MHDDDAETTHKAARVTARVSSRFIALIVACAMFMAQLDTSVVLVALPDMARSFAVRPVDLSIGVTIYILAQAVLLPSSSWVAERFGTRRVFALALAGFTVASVLCGLSRTLPEFIAARVLQGIAAALMTPIARIVLLESTEKEDLVGVMTISTVPMLVAPTLGPPIGGLITTYLSWPWIFLLNVPVGVAGVALVLRFLPRARTPARRPFDFVGFLLVAIATAALLSGLDQLSNTSSSWRIAAVLIALGCVLGVLAVRHLDRHPHPVLSLRAARIHTFAATTLGGGALVRLPVRALPFILPLLFQEALGYSAVHSGLLLLAMNGGDLVLKTLTTRTLRAHGFRKVLVASVAVMMVAVAVCAVLAGLVSYWIIFAILLVSGMARSLVFTGLSTLAFADVPREELGSSSVLWNLVLQVTSALGISVAALLLNLTSFVLGEPLGHVTVRNCQVALGVMAIMGALSIFSFLRLRQDAGAAVSGHAPGTTRAA